MDGVGEAFPVAGGQPDEGEGHRGRYRVGEVEHEIDSARFGVVVEALRDVVANEGLPLRDRPRREPTLQQVSVLEELGRVGL